MGYFLMLRQAFIFQSADNQNKQKTPQPSISENDRKICPPRKKSSELIQDPESNFFACPILKFSSLIWYKNPKKISRIGPGK